MKENIGLIDKIIRAIIGIGLIWFGTLPYNILQIVGTILILAAVIGRCGLYTILGINTKK